MKLTSLLLVEERLLEPDYFCRRMKRSAHDTFGYDLNAFLSAARSTTFLMQKEMSMVPGFRDWWAARRSRLADDEAATFFVELRNFSQKEGRISLAGTRATRRSWSYRFAGGSHRAPASLLHRDVVDCCREHLAKLAAAILDCMAAFPYATCPAQALTPDGVGALGLSPADIAAAAGLPPAWMDASEAIPWPEQLRILRGYVDAVDVDAIRRLAAFRPRRRRTPNGPSFRLSEAMLVSLVNGIEGERIDLPGVAIDIVTTPPGSRGE